MATTIKVTDYESVKPNNEDILLLNQGGENKNTTVQKLLENVNTKIGDIDVSSDGDVATQLNALAKKNYTTETIFKNGWALESGGTIIKNGNIVLINMNISSGVATNGTTVFTVPSEIIPKNAKNIIASNYNSSGHTPVLCALGTDGNMNLDVGINNNLSLRFQVSYCVE